MRSSKILTIMLLALFALGLTQAGSRVYRHFGPGISGDSFRYLSMSQHIASGQGVKIYHNQTGGQSIPMLNFPPLYPAIIALGLKVGLSMQSATTHWNSLCFFLNLFLIGCFIFRITGNAWPSLAGMWIVGCDRNLLEFSNYVLTESTFLPLCTFVGVFLYIYLRRSEVVWLILAGFTIGLATLTRYIGIGLIPGACISILILSGASVVRRIKHAGILLFTAIFPLASWLSWNLIVHQTSYDKGLPGTDTTRYFFWDLFQDLISHLMLYPEKNGYLSIGIGVFFTVSLLGLISGMLCFCLYQKKIGSKPLAAIFMTFFLTLSYVIVLGFIMGWRHLSTVTDPVRYLVPAYNYIWVMSALTVWVAIQKISNIIPMGFWKALRATFCLFIFFICMHFFAQANHWIAMKSIQGIDGTRYKSWNFISSIYWFPLEN